MKIGKGTPGTESAQLMIDSGINVFGADLLAESFARQKVFPKGDVLLIRRGKDGSPVYIVISMTEPVFEDEEAK